MGSGISLNLHMISISILGTGNVARQFFEVFSRHPEIEIVQVLGRHPGSLVYFKDKASTAIGFESVKKADIYLIVVSDDAISEVSYFLKDKGGLVVHASGSLPLSALQANGRTGVFYPVQTFSQNKTVDFRTIPICLETRSETDMELLRSLAFSISDRVYCIDSEQRRNLHLAAVFANNFSNHLFHIAHEVCLKNEISFDILRPLILETAKKIEKIPPYASQTGPARRNDRGTMQGHMDLLTNENHLAIYRLLSRSIQETYGKEL